MARTHSGKKKMQVNWRDRFSIQFDVRSVECYESLLMSIFFCNKGWVNTGESVTLPISAKMPFKDGPYSNGSQTFYTKYHLKKTRGSSAYHHDEQHSNHAQVGQGVQ